MPRNTSTKVDNGTVSLKNFAIVDEQNLAALVEGHPEGGAHYAAQIPWYLIVHGQVRSSLGSHPIMDALITGDSLGGSGEGFIYTDKKQYDLVGTVIPAFGINNAFGRLFGGGETGGMFGITFAVRGPLDKPNFQVNPLSALAPGAFRGLFEYRAKEAPRVD